MQCGHVVAEIGTLARKETSIAQGISCRADRSSKSNEVQVQGQRFFLWDERAHPFVGLFCVHPFWNEPQSLPDPVNMGIHRKGLPLQPKEKKAMERLRTDAFQGADRFLDFFGSHLSQKGEAQFSLLFFNPPENFTDASRLLLRQSSRADG
jgi:hypothetical protein